MWMNQLETDVGFPCDNRIPPHVNGHIHKMICQSTILYETETVPMASSHMNKLEGTEMEMCR